MDETFNLFRRYDKLVRRQLATPLLCNTCDTRVTTLLDKDDELILKCFVCGSSIKPGKGLIDRMKKVVEDKLG